MLAQRPEMPSRPVALTDLVRDSREREPVRNLILYEPDAAQVFDASRA